MLDQGLATASIFIANNIPLDEKFKKFLNSFGTSLLVSSLVQLYKDVYKPLKQLDQKSEKD